MVDISVIMPVYNDSKYIKNAVKSLLNQSLRNIEIIIVIDGSTDESESIIDGIVACDKRVIKVVQENQGISKARNKGIALAKGKYIAFADADDTVPKRAYEKMYQIAENNDADLVIGGFKKNTGLSSKRNHRMVKLAKKPSVEVDDEDIIHSFAVWNKIFKRDIIADNNILFEPFKHVEDAVFLYSFLQHAQKVFTCPDIVYIYYKRIPALGTSTTQTLKPGLFDDAIKACNRILDLTKDWSEDFKEELRYKILRSTIIGDYYRRLWVLDQDTLINLFEQINIWKDNITSENWNRIVSDSSDLELQLKIKTCEDIAECPLISIIIDPKLNKKDVNYVLDSLYNQNTPNFQVILHQSQKQFINSGFKDKMNLKFISKSMHGAKYADFVLKGIVSTYVMFIDKAIIFDHDSLRLMIKAIEKNNVDFVSAKMVGFRNKTKYTLWSMEKCFDKDYMQLNGDPEGRNLLDLVFCNKIFRTETLKDKSYLLKNRTPKAIYNLYNTISYKKLTSPIIAFLEDEVELLKKANLLNKALKKEYRSIIRKKKKDKFTCYFLGNRYADKGKKVKNE